MASLHRAIWLIVLQYLREYDYDIDGHLWRVRLVCRTLSALADSLIWRKVSLIYDAEYKSSSCMPYDLERPFKSLLDVVKWADWSEGASKCYKTRPLVPFLDTIKHYTYMTQLEDRYSVIQHIEAAEEIIDRDEDMKPGNKLFKALLLWRKDRTKYRMTGIKAITEALAAPFRGYPKPKYFSTEIHLYNIDGMRNIVARYYPYIKHVRLIIGEGNGCGNDIRHFAEIFKHTRLVTVDATLKRGYLTNELETRKQQIKILREIVKNPPQRLIIDVKYRLTHDIAEILNMLPSDRGGTQLIIQSADACDNLTANRVSMTVRGIVDIARLLQSLSLHKSLAHLDIYNFREVGNLKLPDSVIDFTIVGRGKKVRISGRYVKSFSIGNMAFAPDAFAFPELEYLYVQDRCVYEGVSDRQVQRPFPKLKRLECKYRYEYSLLGLDFIAWLEALRPSHSVTLPYNAPPVDWLCKNNIPRIWSLLFSRHLPPTVAFIRLASTKLRPDDLYFFQRLLARQSISQVHIMSYYSGHSFGLEMIPSKYRTLVSSTSSPDDGAHISDTYALNPDFVKARLRNVAWQLRHLLATSPRAKHLLASLDE